MVDKECFLRLPLNDPRDPLAMTWAQQERFKNQQVQCALQQGDAIVVIVLGSHSTQVCRSLGRMSTQRSQAYRAIAFEPLKGTGFSPCIAAMPKNGLQPPRDMVEEGRLVRVQSLRG